MRKHYEAPRLFVENYAADTMIASTIYMPGGGPKNGNAGNNQNCWSYNCVVGAIEDGQNACLGDSFSRNC